MAVKSNFASGDVLTASDVNTYLTNGGLVYIGESTTTGANNTDVTGCFSSTYNAYRVVVSNLSTSFAGADMAVRMLNGTTPTTTGYYSSMTYASGSYAAPTGFAFAGQGGGANTYFYTACVSDATNKAGFAFDVINPNLAATTTLSSLGTDPRTGGAPLRTAWGFLNDTTQYTGLRFYAVSGAINISTIKIAVYGYRQA